MVKILYCNPSFWDYRLPFYLELTKLFKGEFYVVYSTRRYGGKEHLLNRIKTELGNHALPYEKECMFDVKTCSFNHFTEEGKHIPFPLGLWKRISRVKPDVLITEGFFQWTPIVQLWGMTHRVPVFMGYERTLHTERRNSCLKTWIRKWQDRGIAGYLVNGQETEAYLKSIGVSVTKIHKVGMCADSKGLQSAIASLTEQEKTAFKNRYARGKGGYIFLFTGKLIERKGVIPLLKAWKDHIRSFPHDTLVLVGDGELYEDCKALAGNEPSVFLEGRVDYEAIHRYYAMADVYVLPTIEDNWSLVVPEAMACGLPVATSIYNGCHAELVREGENGIVFDTFQPDSMLRALAYFHRVDLKTFGRRSIELEKAFSTEVCAKRTHEAIIQSVSLR